MKFNPESLHVEERIDKYTGNASPHFNMCEGGSAHVLPDPRAPVADGSFIGVMGCQPLGPGKQSLTVYRVASGNIKERSLIATIEMDTYSYMHSFSMTENHIIILA